MKRILKITFALSILLTSLFFLYCNNTSGVDKKTLLFYKQLRDTLKKRNLPAHTLIISAKRFKWHNALQVKFSGAAKNSRHLKGEAIDLLVFDINSDGKSNKSDVDIVYKILDKEIIKGKGGIGTYKNGNSFIERQMIHIDCRGTRARWNR